MKQNEYKTIPSQALKTWRHFDRFNVEHYHRVLNERKDREVELINKQSWHDHLSKTKH